MAYSGQILDGKYRIVSELGRGGMSVVYLAVDVRLNKKWAVKEIRNSVGTYMAEADVIKNFDHPVLPRIVDVITDNELAFIVMDYIEGRSLNEVLRCEGPQSYEKVVRWAESLCDALIYLHGLEKPVIYRDMKPSNIMLKPDGSVRLIDFGAAVRIGAENMDDGFSFGTMGYAAPELLGDFLIAEYGVKLESAEQSFVRGGAKTKVPAERPFARSSAKTKVPAGKLSSVERTCVGYTDERSDIYSLGATIFTLLTGEVPKHPDKMKALMENYKSLIPRRLGKIIIKCMSYYPGERYASCEELQYQLHKCRRSYISCCGWRSSGFEKNESRRSESRNSESKSVRMKNFCGERFQSDIIKLVIIILALVLMAGVILFVPINRHTESGSLISEETVNGSNEAELFMQMGLDFFERFKDYKKSAGYFELAEKSGVKEAKMYREISDALSKLDVDYVGLAVMLSEFEEMTDALSDNDVSRKLDNYKLIGDVYNEYCMYIKESDRKLVDIGEKALSVLEKCDEKEKTTDNYITFYQYTAIGYERMGDILVDESIDEAKKDYSSALEDIDCILDILDKETDITVGNVGMKEMRKTKLLKKAELLTKLSLKDDACSVYEEAEAEYGDDGIDFYIGHLSLLCEIEELKTADVEQWDYEKIIGLYDKCRVIRGIDNDYRWKRLVVKINPLMEKRIKEDDAFEKK